MRQTRTMLGLFLAASILALAGALTSQFGFGLHPCKLCFYQRFPYGAVIALTTALLFYKEIARPGFAFLVIGAIFAAGAVIAFYHTGIEYKWWEGAGGCTGSGTPDSIDALRAMIQEAAMVRCDEPAFVFLGLSMAGWNVLYSLGLAALALRQGIWQSIRK